MLEDVRFAFRQLFRHPAFAVVAVPTLALGIGAAAAMFGLIQGVLLLRCPTPSRTGSCSWPLRGPTARRTTSARRPRSGWRGGTAPRSTGSRSIGWTFNFLVQDDGSESLSGMWVSRNYFQVLGLKPVAGRVFTDEEASRPKVPPTAVIIGYDLWQRKFSGDPKIIGRPIRISRQAAPLPVVGVMPPGVRFLPDPGNASEPNYDVNARVDFWLARAPDESELKGRGGNVVGRLRSGVTAAQADAEVARLSATLAKSDPDLEGHHRDGPARSGSA